MNVKMNRDTPQSQSALRELVKLTDYGTAQYRHPPTRRDRRNERDEAEFKEYLVHWVHADKDSSVGERDYKTMSWI